MGSAYQRHGYLTCETSHPILQITTQHIMTTPYKQKILCTAYIAPLQKFSRQKNCCIVTSMLLFQNTVPSVLVVLGIKTIQISNWEMHPLF